MATKPSDRYATGLDLAADVEHWLADDPVSAHPDSVTAKIKRWSRRHFAMLSSAASLLLTAVVVLAISYVALRAEQNRTEIAKRKADEAAEREKIERKQAAIERQIRQRSDYGEASRSIYDLLEVGKVASAKDLAMTLAGETPSLRGWEWYLAMEMMNYAPKTTESSLLGYCIAWSPDDSQVAFGRNDEIVLVDSVTGKSLKTLELSPETSKSGRRELHRVTAVAWSRDGTMIAGGDDWGQTWIWQADNATLAKSLPACDSVVGNLVWKPDGMQLTVVDKLGKSTIWSTATWEFVASEERQHITANSEIAKDLLWEFPSQSVLTQSNWEAMAFGFVFDRNAPVESSKWLDLHQAKVVPRRSISGEELERIRQSSVRKLEAGLGAQIAYIVDDATGIREHILYGMPKGEMSNDQQRIVLAKRKQQDLRETMDEWTIWHLPRLTFAGHSKAVESVRWISNGKFASASSDGTVRIWDVQSGESRQIASVDKPLTELEFNSATGALAASGVPLLIWLDVDAPPVDNSTRLGMRERDTLEAITWHPSTNQLAFLHGPFVIWDAAQDARISTQPILDDDRLRGRFGFAVYTAAWSPDGTRVAIGGAMQNGSDRKSGSSLNVAAVERDRTENEVVGNLDSRLAPIVMVNVDEKAPELFWTHGDDINCIVWNPTGTRLASGGKDRTIIITDAQTGRQMHKLMGHEGMIYGLAWHPTEERLASASYDGTVRIWDTITGRQVAMWKAHAAAATTVDWSPDGSRLLSGGSDCRCRVWDAGDKYRQAVHNK